MTNGSNPLKRAYWALQGPIAVRDGPTGRSVAIRDRHRGELTPEIRRDPRFRRSRSCPLSSSQDLEALKGWDIDDEYGHF
ncbi:hypothetical protein E3N88_19402 [Mikania micrantha]|uniref:Uncharacterized protein n=1 Tax=Mikania micrantha TaxID=192012 RepID=A0A5N6NN25_9ASTR|nr:hypothetical protein E3N88_19402 [Mikania micrantha]